MNKRTAAIMTATAFLLLLVGIAGAQTFANQVLLPGTLIPKFVDQLPVATTATVPGISVVDATAAPGNSYNLHIREFQAQILPSTGIPASKKFAFAGLAANTSSSVWGYLTDADVAALGTTPVRPSYLGPAVIAKRGLPAYPTYLNELPYGSYAIPADPNSSKVLPLLPIDQTLIWANPLGACSGGSCLGPYTDPEIPVAVHIHGGEVAPAFDGGPDAWFTQDLTAPGVPGGYARKVGKGFPGNTYTYPNDQQESTIWFHDHALGVTRLNVYAGLAGIYPIVDLIPDGLGGVIPGPSAPIAAMPAFPQHDIPLIIQDRSFDTTGQIFYNLASNPQPNQTIHPFWIPEFIGDTIVVNGKTWPNLKVEPRQYRFRLLNGSNARFYDLRMTKGRKFIAIATDGGYLQNAVSTNNIIIGPGERYEVIVDFKGLLVGDRVILSNSARTPFPGGGRVTPNGTDTVMQFTVVANTSGLLDTAIVNGTPLRSVTSPIQPISTAHIPAQGSITRQLTLNEILGPGGPLELVINNSKFELTGLIPGSGTPLGRETELPAVGDTEIWEIINISADAHPMHTHLVTFQILDRTPFDAATWITQYDALLLQRGVNPGQGPPNSYSVKNADGAIGGNPPINAFLNLGKRTLPLPYEMGWKDTAIMYPGEVTRIVVRWAPTDAPATGTGAPVAGTNLYPSFDPSALQGGVGYVWHCHIIDHEDNEMMRNYVVGTARQPVQ